MINFDTLGTLVDEGVNSTLTTGTYDFGLCAIQTAGVSPGSPWVNNQTE